MNAPPALVEAFLARLGRVLDTARALPRERVLIQGRPVGYRPDRERPALTVGGPPFTVGDALARLEHKEPAMAAEMATELYRLAVALVDPAALVRVLDVTGRGDKLVNSWPLPCFEPEYAGSVGVAWNMLNMLINASLPRPHDTDWALSNPWPVEAPPDDVTRWAQDAFDRGWPAGVRRYIGIGLALLYLAERAELPRVRATVAARLAFASVRAIGSVRYPGPLHTTALEAVLRKLAATDTSAAAALANEGIRVRLAGALVSEARGVAEVVFTGDAPEGEPEARVLAGEMAERFATVLDGLDVKAGAVVRRKAKERAAAAEHELTAELGGELGGELWALWLDLDAPEAPPTWLRTLARALWVARWSKDVKLPGFTVRTGRALVGILSPAAVVHRGPVVTEIVSLAGRLAGQIEGDDVRRMMPPTVNAEAVRRMTSEIVKARAATAAVYALVQAVYTVTDLENQGDTSLRASWGSWPEWVAAVSSTFDVDPTNELAGALKRAAWFGNAVQVPLFDGRIQRGLWTLTAPDPFKRGAPRAGDSRVVTFGYAPIFSHKWASQENPDDKGRGVRLVVIPRTFPIGVADRTVRAPVLLFTLDVLAEAAMCPNPGRGMVLSEQRRAELARGVGLPDAYAPRQLSAMVEAGILEAVGPDRYRLGSEEARTKASPKRQRKAKKPGST